MLKKVIDSLGSRRFSMWLLKAAAVYMLYLTVIWVVELLPTKPMIWGPLALWGIFFLANVLISLIRDKYRYNGNFIMHGAFFVLAVGFIIGALFRIEAQSVVVNNTTFYADRDQLQLTGPEKLQSSLKNNLDLYVDRIDVEFLMGKQYFTTLRADISYPASTRANKASLYLNDGVNISGTRLKLSGFGIMPKILIKRLGKYAHRGTVELSLFPPGVRESINVGAYELTLALYTDPAIRGGVLTNKSLNITNPMLELEAKWLGNEAFRGVLNIGETVKFGGVELRFDGIERYVV
ncbi:MAG: hypothetical protein KAR06_04025, partial [Deltaproteobacteria bacterium]|nr:hypothetical protein [Deltaproteobacteria bacterium]